MNKTTPFLILLFIIFRVLQLLCILSNPSMAAAYWDKNLGMMMTMTSCSKNHFYGDGVGKHLFLF